MKSAAKLILLNLIIFIFVDQAFGLLFPTPNYLNKKKYEWDLYESNYRDYFDPIYRHNKLFYGIDNSKINLELIRKPKKDFKGKKIHFFGDSFTKGQGVRVTDTFSNKISFATNDEYRGLNLGQSGDNALQILKRMQNFKSEYKEDVAIYVYCLNDIRYFSKDNNLESAEINGIPNGEEVKWDFINLRTTAIEDSLPSFLYMITRFSNIAKWILRKIEIRRITEGTILYYKNSHSLRYNKEGVTKFKETLRKMESHFKKRDVHFALVIFPILFWEDGKYLFVDAHRTIKEIAKELNVSVLDLSNALVKYPAKRLWVHPIDQHPNDLAHDIAAKEIAHFIRKSFK